MYAQLQIKGQVLKVLEKEYQDKITYNLQFLTQSDKTGYQLISVKTIKEFLPTNIKDNDQVEVSIKITSMNNILYFSANDKIIILNK